MTDTFQEYSEWTTCDAICEPGVQTRYRLDSEGVGVEGSLETRTCDADDLKCGMSLGLPAIGLLVIVGVVYWICRRNSDESTELRRGHERLTNYKSALNHA